MQEIEGVSQSQILG